MLQAQRGFERTRLKACKSLACFSRVLPTSRVGLLRQQTHRKYCLLLKECKVLSTLPHYPTKHNKSTPPTPTPPNLPPIPPPPPPTENTVIAFEHYATLPNQTEQEYRYPPPLPRETTAEPCFVHRRSHFHVREKWSFFFPGQAADRTKETEKQTNI